ncbi:gp586 [Bacillus phage G]|uniref:Gp586 n=1 Tax=Bacillus phage G TaxID=2884420 RepID=G3MAW6_9CAUD|nr:gp586 [Bacillus phage G]AEO93831.1 gp586 [Bacillus phage G]
MKSIIGIILILMGIVLGAYVGIWICFVGGIIDIIDTAKAGLFETKVIAWGVAKIVFASTIGALAGYVLIIPGWAMIGSSKF